MEEKEALLEEEKVEKEVKKTKNKTSMVNAATKEAKESEVEAVDFDEIENLSVDAEETENLEENLEESSEEKKAKDMAKAAKISIATAVTTVVAAGAVVGGMILSAPQTRKVVYVVNGQEVELQVDKDKTLAEIQKPVIEGYDFEGWYSDAELTNKLDNNFVFVEDAVIYPKFVPKNCQVEYYANYGTGDVFFQEVVFKSEYKLMENKFERENYVFVGWSIDPNSHYDDENVVKQNKRETLLTEGVKYYAIWI